MYRNELNSCSSFKIPIIPVKKKKFIYKSSEQGFCNANIYNYLFYRYDRDLKWRTGVELVLIHCLSSNDFEITNFTLEEAYQKAQKLSLNVKRVFITNPSNPLGTTMSHVELDKLITFVVAKNFHLISDEIFYGTVFENSSFISIIEAVINRKLEKEKTDLWSRVHIVYSLSKDFNIPGFRVGMIYFINEKVVSTATKMSSYDLISSKKNMLLFNPISLS